ncbi:MAG: hypothetical protein ACOCP8_01890 [archaeon]
MGFKIKRDSEEYGYYIIYSNDGIKLKFDEDIAKLLHIQERQYQQNGIKYGGKLINYELYFEKESDVKKFIDKYLYPYKMMIKLAGEI